ncbi:MAG: ABC transporter ATP-binding protein [Cytophagales bacterium]|nr:MAG: ABC transporter ATP-binding protein [Cytophagales bacterium]TAF60300.1 MAG: ABC transporter ATP-binding protein [Cytophagales bacterium]
MSSQLTYLYANEIIYQIASKWSSGKEDAFFELNLNNFDTAEVSDFQDWYTYLQERAVSVHIHFLEKEFEVQGLLEFLVLTPLPVLLFKRTESGNLPIMIWRSQEKKFFKIEKINGRWLNEEIESIDDFAADFISKIELYGLKTKEMRSSFYVLVPIRVEPTVSDKSIIKDKYSAVRRLWYLLQTEKKDIAYVYLYAVVAGLLSLTLPLGIQSIINLISGGIILSSVVVLIVVVVVGTSLGGFLQVMQMRIVEAIQQRIFTRAAFEFSYRVPKIKLESISKYHAPELMNRFFDVLTLQKGLAKLLTDLIAAALQVFFGVFLLTFYHPFFVFFGVTLLTILALIFWITGPKGLKTSIEESNHKFEIAHWLEELARTMSTFKMLGNPFYPLSRTNGYLTKYLRKRKLHFNVLAMQYSSVVIFKTIITGGVLILGSLLVVNNEITIGQFVASEIVIITVVSAVEKLILSMDSVYDLLTSTEKIAKVTDLPLEEYESTFQFNKEGFGVKIQNLSYTYPYTERRVLRDITLEAKPGQHVGIVGGGGVGKTTLMNVLVGLYGGYKGLISYNGFSLKDLDVNNLRNHIGDNLNPEEVFEGSFIDNITLGRKTHSQEELVEALEIAELTEFVSNLPEGINTKIMPAGKNFASHIIKKIILARSILGKPNLMVFDAFFYNLDGDYKRRMLDKLLDKNKHNWTILAVSQDPIFLKRLDKIYLMRDGAFIKDGTYDELLQDEYFRSIIPSLFEDKDKWKH